MSDLKDGGAAFPGLDYFVRPDGTGGVQVSDGGMSLRDYFAGQALNGVVATEAAQARRDGEPWGYERIARHSYAMADAMLKHREAKAHGDQ